MTSRHLWLFLSLLAIPLVLETTTGCDYVFTLSPPQRINAYTCQCTCNAGNRELTRSVQASADDADERLSDGVMTLGAAELRIIADFRTGVRFAALGIPPGAQITDASVQFTSDRDAPGSASFQIRIENADDAQPFTANPFDLNLRALAAGTVDWSPPPWTANAQTPDQRTPSLATLVQQVVSRPGWTSASSLVLVFASTSGDRIAQSFDRDPVKAPALRVTFKDPTTTFAADLPVCVEDPDDVNPTADGNGDGVPDDLQADCSGRVENTYKDLVGACGYVQDAASNCDCAAVPTNFTDRNANGTFDSGEGYFGFIREICGDDRSTCTEVPLNLPPDPNDPARCDNFDPKGFADCVGPLFAACDGAGIAPEDCNIDGCLAKVSATNVAGEAPVCVSHASESPSPVAFQLFGRRSLCDVSGLSHIEVGDDGREPKKDPLTRGTLELFGGPCPGQSCFVGLSTQLAMNPIEFEVKWHSNPKFRDLVQSGNSALGAAKVEASGLGTLPAHSAVAVGSGRRASALVELPLTAYLGVNGSPVDLGVDWAGHSCSLNGNLVSTVDAEDVEGLCAGDGATVCRTDSPDCDAVGGPCELPADPEPLNVNVALAGTLVNQPPTAKAGDDQTVECTSPAGATFLIDGTQSSDPDGDMRVASWRSGTRTGPEVGSGLRLTDALGVGQSRGYVLRVIDGFAQADEDPVTVGVVDTTPPTITSASVTPSSLRPPNHKMVPVTMAVTAEDVCSPTVSCRIASISSNEPVNDVGDGDTTPDWQITGDLTAKLKAERSGTGSDRVYGLTVACSDATGNTATRTANVTVPH